MMKKLLWIVLLIVALSTAVSALQANIDEVEVEDTVLSASSTNQILGLEKNDEIDVKVQITSTSAVDIEDAQIEVYLRGYDHDDLIEDISDVFDIKAGVTYSKKFTLALPLRMDQDRYKLRVRVENREGNSTEATYELEVDTARHALQVKDLVLSPENEVKAGRALLATVRIKNRGEMQEEDIKVKVSIPELGISASDYVDEIDQEDGSDDSVTSEELYLRIPQCAEPGEYTVKAEVLYDDGDEKETFTSKILIVEDETCSAATPDAAVSEAKTIITIGPEVQDVKVGAGAVYPVTLTNAGAETRTYTVSVDGASWADFTISPSNAAVVKSGESKAVYITVMPKKGASAGENSFVVSVKSGDNVLKQVGLKANVTGASGLGSVKKALMVGLLVIVVLLVILGLIIGFSKLKGNEEASEGKEETYY